ncbi:MAG: aspartate/glutamate racemase family protein [Thermoanaerobaculia bacterium]
MKTIGLLGGMSWESTVPYYRIVNRVVGKSLGGLHSARILLYSVDFQPIEELQHAGRWEEAGEILAEAAGRLETAGADFLVLCTNTMHKVAPQIEEAISIPFLHIADATADEIKQAGLRRTGLLGTRFTMEEEFYRGRLEDRHQLEVIVPNERDRQMVHRVIYDELCLGTVDPGSRRAYSQVIRRLADEGAEGIILGCTEISLLVTPEDSPVPLFDTTEIHARRAAEWALAEGLGA